MSDIVLSDEQRATGAALLDRIESDPSFADRVNTDPVGTLTELGLGEEAIPYVLLEAVKAGLYGDDIPEEPEVEGLTWTVTIPVVSIRFCAITGTIATNCAMRATVCIRTMPDKKKK
jgi:hypothetical protein